MLRWSIDSEPDLHFRLRPYLTRHTPCRCGCGISSSIYPDGIAHGSVAPAHLHSPTMWARHRNTFRTSPFDRFLDASPPPPLGPYGMAPPPPPLTS